MTRNNRFGSPRRLSGLAAMIGVLLCADRLSAYECAAVEMYTETWHGDSVSGDTIPIYGRLVADSGEPCNIEARAALKNPSGQEIDVRWGNAPSHVEVNVSSSLNIEGAAEGDYTTFGESWSQGVHKGCAFSFMGTQLFRCVWRQGADGVYRKTGDAACNHRCHANTVTCQDVGPFLKRNGIFFRVWVGPGIIETCVGKDAAGATFCSGPPGSPITPSRNCDL